MQRPSGERKGSSSSVATAKVRMETGRSRGSAQKVGVRDEDNELRWDSGISKAAGSRALARHIPDTHQSGLGPPGAWVQCQLEWASTSQNRNPWQEGLRR